MAAARWHFCGLVACGIGYDAIDSRFQTAGSLESRPARLPAVDEVHGVWLFRLCHVELRCVLGKRATPRRIWSDASDCRARLFGSRDGFLLGGDGAPLLRRTCERPRRRAKMPSGAYRWATCAVLRTMWPACYSGPV